jgi:hypothetical protein
MISSVDSYRTSLTQIIEQTTLDESNWNYDAWKEAWNGIDEDVLQDAFSQHTLALSLFEGLGEISHRDCKSIDRVKQKMVEQTPGKESYFKVVSDFIAVRISCKVTEIQEK